MCVIVSMKERGEWRKKRREMKREGQEESKVSIITEIDSLLLLIAKCLREVGIN